jgi:hypothetical protein
VLDALGIVKCTRNMGGSANGRTANMYAPTFLPRDPTKNETAKHEYLEIKTAEEAQRRAEIHRVHEKRRDRISLPRMRKLKVVSAPLLAKT